MALFNSGNPTLSEKIFSKSLAQDDSSVMSVKGTMSKFLLLLFLTIAGAIYSWTMYDAAKFDTLTALTWTGAIGGLVCVLVMSFRPQSSKYLAPLYSVLEGFFLGGLSVIVNAALAKKYPNVVFMAVGVTFAVGIAMYLLYTFRVIKPTQKFKSVIISATCGIALFYLANIVLRLFHVDLPFMYDGSPLGIGISLFVIAIAALNLIVDFGQIEEGAAMGAPKFMEWYGAFGLLVTIVWLYVEVLKLFMRLANSKN
ncbi:MAG: Bax inhibitor-1/YccA family protein [Chitinophagaceae bacterium]